MHRGTFWHHVLPRELTTLSTLAGDETTSTIKCSITMKTRATPTWPVDERFPHMISFRASRETWDQLQDLKKRSHRSGRSILTKLIERAWQELHVATPSPAGDVPTETEKEPPHATA